MLWIHGGGHVAGSGTAALYDGTHLAEQGVVVVTINYRLGRFGYFAHPALTRENPAGPLGNYALMDQIAALEWVACNIAAFGGDPGNVTMFGESSGGAAVNRLMISPAARGLFHRAISQSGLGRERSPYLNRKGANGMPSAEEQGSVFAASLGRTGADAAALRALPAETILAGGDPNPMWGGGPIIDGQLLRDDVADAFARGAQAPVPYLVGSNALELAGLTPATPWVFGDAFKIGARGRADLIKAYGSEESFESNVLSDYFFTEPARELARLHARSSAPVYLYRFSVISDAVRDKFKGAPHASERQYVFRTLNASPWPTGPMDERAAEIISACWVAFAKAGSPHRLGQPVWPRFSERGDELLNFTNDGPVIEKVPNGPVLDAIAEGYRLDAPAAGGKQRGDLAGQSPPE
jgi:para-nitrobenzyl esterase